VKYDGLMGAINDAYILFRNSSSEYLLRELRIYVSLANMFHRCERNEQEDYNLIFNLSRPSPVFSQY
jgi:hypothetical protein